MVREYTPGNLEIIVSLFGRSVREVAGRDYSPAQVSAWAPEPPDFETWARRLNTSGVFVCERGGQIVGFERIDDTGCLDLLYEEPEVKRQGVAMSRSIGRLHSDVSLTARLFFESAGFCVVAERIVERRGVSCNNFRMERRIDAEPPVAAVRRLEPLR